MMLVDSTKLHLPHAQTLRFESKARKPEQKTLESKVKATSAQRGMDPGTLSAMAAVQKSAPPHPSAWLLLQEIQAQPACLRQMLSAFPENFHGLQLPETSTKQLIGVGEGSSNNVLKIAAPVLQMATGLSTTVLDPESVGNLLETAGITNLPASRPFENGFFLSVSQSGKTGSLLKAVGRIQKARQENEQAFPMIPFTNNDAGTLGITYGNHFYLNVGKEQSIAATKSFTASLMALLLFGLHTGQVGGTLPPKAYRRLYVTLDNVPAALERLLQDQAIQAQVKSFAEQLKRTNQFVLLSKGPLSTVLPEAGLKLTETSSNFVRTDNIESFKHGPKVILQGVNNIPPNTIYVIPPGLSKPEAQQLFQDIHSHFYANDQKQFSTDHVFFVTFENSPPVPKSLRKALNLKSDNRILTLPR